MITKKDVVKAIDSAVAILMVLFVGMTLQSMLYLTNLGILPTWEAFKLFGITVAVLVALFVLLQFVDVVV